VLLNQGYVEQAFLDHLQQKGRIVVEWNTRAKHLKIDNEGLVRTDTFPLIVDISKLRQDGSEESTEVVRAKYLIGCDGAHSWTRKEMGVTMHEHSTDSVWGVMDIELVTDFRMLFLFWSREI
jgi:2-polyprenyl-6-methoxyphenol hydroxylase-like FAD-dependent oxidoreductase